jgi:hypothetical protein
MVLPSELPPWALFLIINKETQENSLITSPISFTIHEENRLQGKDPSASLPFPGCYVKKHMLLDKENLQSSNSGCLKNISFTLYQNKFLPALSQKNPSTHLIIEKNLSQ